MDDTNKKQSGLSWSQPAMPTQNAQSKPASASGLGATPSAMQKPIVPQQPKPMAQKSAAPSGGSTGRVVMGFIAGLIVGALIVSIWFTSGGSGSTGSTATTTSMTDTTGASDTTGMQSTTGDVGAATIAPSSNPTITVPSPQAAGMTVGVTYATVSVPTWLVVYESANGQPTRALGAALFFPENNGKGGLITLLRATVSGQTYLVGERADDGDHVFSLTNDKPVLDSNGNQLWTMFTAQ